MLGPLCWQTRTRFQGCHQQLLRQGRASYRPVCFNHLQGILRYYILPSKLVHSTSGFLSENNNGRFLERLLFGRSKRFKMKQCNTKRGLKRQYINVSISLNFPFPFWELDLSLLTSSELDLSLLTWAQNSTCHYLPELRTRPVIIALRWQIDLSSLTWAENSTCHYWPELRTRPVITDLSWELDLSLLTWTENSTCHWSQQENPLLSYWSRKLLSWLDLPYRRHFTRELTRMLII